MSTLAKLLRGGPAHLDPIACLDGLTWKLAGARAPGLPHTIWELVCHLNYWIDLELRSMEGPELQYPKDLSVSWPASEAPADESAWQHEVALHRTNLDQLVTLADAQASTLARIIHPKSGTTVESILLGLMAHNSYHIGQVVQVRQALGVWPPPETK